MTLRLEDKKNIIAEVNEVAQSALSAVVLHYRGLTVNQITKLRKQARDGGIYLKIVCNTLAKRALQGTHFTCLENALVGPTLLAFSQKNPGVEARLIKDFAKKYNALTVKALSISGQILSVDQIDILAKMPTLNQARAILITVIISPITKLIRTVNEFPSSIIRLIAAISDEKKKTTNLKPLVDTKSCIIN